MLAGVGSGIYRDTAEALGVVARRPAVTIEPDDRRHRLYAGIFEQQFQPWQQCLAGVQQREA